MQDSIGTGSSERSHRVAGCTSSVRSSNLSLSRHSHLFSSSAAFPARLAGSPTSIQRMLNFAARHGISPQTEHFPMSHINEAFSRLEAGKARYRIILDADFL